jgi:hypothetical protein
VENPSCPPTVSNEGLTKSLRVVLATPTGDRPEVASVINSVVDEGNEALLVDCIPKAELHGNSVVKPMKDRLAVRAFRCGGQSQQFAWAYPVEQISI